MTTKKIILIAAGMFGAALLIVSLYIWLNKFTISETGTLGDAVNGLLAPVISAAGAVLIYLSFNAQIIANKMQYESNRMIASQWMYDNLSKMLSSLILEFKELSKADGSKIPVGIDMYKYITNIHSHDASTNKRFIEPLILFMDDYLVLLDQIEGANIPQQNFFRKQLLKFYSGYLNEGLLLLHRTLVEPEYSECHRNYLLLLNRTNLVIHRLKISLEADVK